MTKRRRYWIVYESDFFGQKATAAFDHNPDYYGDSGGASRFFKCLRENINMKIPQELLDYLTTLISTPYMQALYISDISTWEVGEKKDNSWPGVIAVGQPTEEQAADLKRILMPGAHLLLVAPESEPTGHTGTCRIEDAGFDIRDAILWVREAGHFHYVPKASRSEREAGCYSINSQQRNCGRKEGNPGDDNPRNRGVNPIKNFHPCLHPDTLVMTIKGYHPIKEIEIGDRVFSANGEFNAVSDVSRHLYTSTHLYDIHIQGTNHTAPSSDNHPYLIWRPDRKQIPIGGSVNWIEAKDIRKGDYTMTPLSLFDTEKEPVYTGYEGVGYVHEGVGYVLRCVESIKLVPYTGDVMNLSVEGSPTFQTCIGMSHNTVKPIKLMERLLDDVPVANGPILDPFMGSGSTGIACIQTGHDFIGVDSEEDYVGISTSRIRYWDSEQGYIPRLIESDYKPEIVEQEPIDLWDVED